MPCWLCRAGYSPYSINSSNPTAGGSALCHLQALKLPEMELQLVQLVSHCCCPSSLCPGPPQRFLGSHHLHWKHSRTSLSCLCLPEIPSHCSIHSPAPLRSWTGTGTNCLWCLWLKSGGNLLWHSSIIFTAGKSVQQDFWEHSMEPARPLSDFLASPCVS